MLAEKILSGRLKDGFSARDVYRQGWTLLDNRQAVEAAARELEHEQWLRKEATHSSGEPGRPELPRYRINPQLRLSDG